MMLGLTFHSEREPMDPRYHQQNFAIHFPWIDRIFGTYLLPPTAWPDAMGPGCLHRRKPTTDSD